MKEHNPYEEGKQAHAKGVRRRDNPYHLAESAHDSWDDGWVEADNADCERS